MLLHPSTSGPPSSSDDPRPPAWITDPAASRPAVLVVDDDGDTRDALEQILGDAGYPTLGVPSGADALALLRSGVRPCMILVDLMMPGMDGWELIPAIRELDIGRTAIVSMTAGAELHMAPVSADYLSKPFQWDRLLRVVERHCGRPAGGAARTEQDPD